ncbi:hypothetical protein Tco_1270449, partial [Tanacetum coccineum]
TGEVPPKVARKFKKASPSKKESELVPGYEEPVKKGKRLKTPAKTYPWYGCRETTRCSKDHTYCNDEDDNNNEQESSDENSKQENESEEQELYSKQDEVSNNDDQEEEEFDQENESEDDEMNSDEEQGMDDTTDQFDDDADVTIRWEKPGWNFMLKFPVRISHDKNQRASKDQLPQISAQGSVLLRSTGSRVD